MAFEKKNVAEEQLEIRGVVITPQEFKEALYARELNGDDKHNGNPVLTLLWNHLGGKSER